MPVVKPTPNAAPEGPGRSRNHPIEATFLSRTRLNKPGSLKETWHVEFDLRRTGLDYCVGDCFGIYPTNDPALVDAVIATLVVQQSHTFVSMPRSEICFHCASYAP